MRRLKRVARGFTLVELLITIAIAAIMMSFAGPALTDYFINSRLREGGNAVLSEALFTQSEAIKRNGTVQMNVSGGAIEVRNMTAEGLAVDAAGELLRSRALPEGVTADAAVNVAFGGEGRTVPFGTPFTVNLSKSGITCSAEYRCPTVVVDAGGAVRMCGDRTQTCN